MIIYWLMFFLAVLFLVVFGFRPLQQQKIPIYFLTFLCVLMVGFRYEVGCDWDAYMEHFYTASSVNDWESLLYVSTDIGYAILNYLAYVSVDEVWGVNLVAAVVCLLGLARFSLAQPLPLLAFTIAIPYIIIVLFQGYTRQAVAFGFELFALVALMQSQYKRFVFLVFLGATFHKTAAILLPLAALSSTKNKWWTYFWVGITSLLAFYFFIAEYQEALWENYVEANYESSGGGIRVAMNALPAILFLLFRNKFTFNSAEEKKLWLWISILSLVCIPLVFQSSTAVDRIALYLMPIQLYVFTRLPMLFENKAKLISFGVVFLYFTVQFVWLNYATHAFCWVPYHSFLF